MRAASPPLPCAAASSCGRTFARAAFAVVVVARSAMALIACEREQVTAPPRLQWSASRGQFPKIHYVSSTRRFLRVPVRSRSLPGLASVLVLYCSRSSLSDSGYPRPLHQGRVPPSDHQGRVPPSETTLPLQSMLGLTLSPNMQGSERRDSIAHMGPDSRRRCTPSPAASCPSSQPVRFAAW